MSKKLISIILFILICLSALIVLAYSFGNNIPQDIETPPQTNSPKESPGGQLFAVPETPVGTIGLISAAAMAFGIFALLKKQKNKL
jgi:hypothetical protein